MDLLIRIIIVVIVLVAIFAVALSGGTNNAPAPTPTPDSAIGQVVDSYKPLIESAAKSLDAGTTASLTDTLTAHPKPQPSTLELALWPLAIVCSVFMLVVCPSLVIIVWVLARNSETVARLQAEARLVDSQQSINKPGGESGVIG